MSENKKFLIVSDLDGTLLNKDSELSDLTVEQIKKIVNDGNIFCIATGRSFLGSIHIYNKLNLNSVMINHNGSYISNPSDSNFNAIDLVFNKNIAIKILQVEKIRKYITNAFIECKNTVYKFNENYDDHLKHDLSKYYHINLDDENIVNLQGDPRKITHDSYAMFLYLNDDNRIWFDKIIYHIKNISPCLQVRMINMPHTGSIVEINTVFGDKSMGVNYLSSYYGIPRDRIITFGDGENDLRMLSKFKYGFAMKNACDAAKALARHITKYSNDDNGVAWELEYFMKHKEDLS